MSEVAFMIISRIHHLPDDKEMSQEVIAMKVEPRPWTRRDDNIT